MKSGLLKASGVLAALLAVAVFAGAQQRDGGRSSGGSARSQSAGSRPSPRGTREEYAGGQFRSRSYESHAGSQARTYSGDHYDYGRRSSDQESRAGATGSYGQRDGSYSPGAREGAHWNFNQSVRSSYGSHVNETAAVRIDHIPSFRSGGLGDHHDWDAHSPFWHGYRVGYYHYNRWWRDSDFFFGFYLFDPWGPCVVSPWYWYPYLPPYIAQQQVIVEGSDGVNPNWDGEAYNYSADGDDRAGLDYAIDDIVDAFQRDDRRAMDRVIPHDGRVAIYVDGHYSYSIKSDDFYDMFKDNVENARTKHYDIVDVRYDHRDTAKVVARHEYTDPWGADAVTFNTYYLVRGNDGWVVRDFGTSKDRP